MNLPSTFQRIDLFVLIGLSIAAGLAISVLGYALYRLIGWWFSAVAETLDAVRDRLDG